MAKLNKDITLVNPTDLVNDQNANAAPKEIQENINYILNYLNGNKALLSGIFGNLWDYNGDGKRILANGGKFDTFKKYNSWKSLSDFQVSNDTEVSFDSANNKCVYEGVSDETVNRDKWIERDIWIPETLRDQQLFFSIKASGCTSKTDWTTANAEFETIAIQILGGEEDINTFKTVGAWDNHSYYANESYTPEMITAHVPFRTSKNTNSVKIKIFRTVESGYLHIDKVYVGGIATPYDNTVESYNLVNLDINELYDFDNGVTKVISTGVMGHKVPESIEKLRGSDLVTYEIMVKFLRTWVTASGCIMDNLSGKIVTDTTNKIYTIVHDGIESTDSPVVTIELPDASGNLDTTLGREWITVSTGTSGASGYEMIITDDCISVTEIVEALAKPTSGGCDFGISCYTQEVSGGAAKEFQCGYWKDIITNPVRVSGIINLQDGQFQVVLSEVPPTTGYKVNWQINKLNLDCTGTGTSGTSGTVGNFFSPEVALENLNVPLTTDEPLPTAYPNIFGHTSDFQ